jgi:hypothetical protein
MASKDLNDGMSASADRMSDPVAPPSEGGREELNSDSSEGLDDMSDPVAPTSQPGREEADMAGGDATGGDSDAPLRRKQ